MDPTDYLQAWQCIGCGRIEAPQPCVGICQDRKVLLVDANEHEAALARTLRAEARTQADGKRRGAPCRPWRKRRTMSSQSAAHPAALPARPRAPVS